jgi:hypothetical protein
MSNANQDAENRRRNLGFFFDGALARSPDKVAIIDLYGGRERASTYRTLDARSLGPDDPQEDEREREKSARVAETQDARGKIAGVGAAHARRQDRRPIARIDRRQVSGLHDSLPNKAPPSLP